MVTPGNAAASNTSALLEEGAHAVATHGVGRSRLSTAADVGSEFEYKRQARENRRVMYHAHIGLGTWPATRTALHEITDALESDGHRLDRFGLCLESAMGLPEEQRGAAQKETGPRLEAEDWDDVANAVTAQPHLGDFVIGTPASLENTVRALAVGITTLGNIGQYFSFDPPGGWDEHQLRDATLRALGAMAYARPQGAIVHSYLDDGPAMQFSTYGNYLAWAALEKHILNDLLGVRVAHCFGGLVPQLPARAFLALALLEMQGTDGVGSMIYGNTVDYGRDLARNRSVLDDYLLVDIATQLAAPTGHALNPVPLTENIRIPNAAEVIDVQLAAREVEIEARRSSDLFDWSRLDVEVKTAVAYAESASSRIIEYLVEQGVDRTDPGSLLLALRHTEIRKLERIVDIKPPPGLASLEPWKASTAKGLVGQIEAHAETRLDGVRVVVAGLDVHDLAHDVLAAALPNLGAEVISLSSGSTPEAATNAAVAEDADAIVVSTYNGAAAALGKRLAAAATEQGFDGPILIGGVLNQDDGSGLPVDVHDELRRLGLLCPTTLAEVPRLISKGVPST
ncbi:MAG: hypothetical protein GEV10_30295 [Streptosporangiales bacterium]|nr:hypothetical protein [Streptosporangiales bacterium]